MPAGYYTRKYKTVAERFWPRVDKSEGLGPNGDCWFWTGGIQGGGYGTMRAWGQVITKSHRVSYILHYGDIPDDLWVLHSCDVRKCVNPAHLRIGTGFDNAADRETRNRGNHAFGDDNGSRKRPERLKRGEDVHLAKTNEQEVLEIRRKYATGNYTVPDLLKEHTTIKRTAMRYIVIRHTWKHI